MIIIKILFTFILLGLIFLAIIIMVVLKGVKKLKKETADNFYRDQKVYKQEKNTARRTTTSSGVTIIDGRNQKEKRKIFDHSDGEYVEFEEV